MRRFGRKGLVAVGSVAVVALVAVAWFAARPEPSAAAPKAPAAFASTLSPTASASVATPSPSPSPTKTVAPPPKAVPAPTPRSTRASTPKPKPAFRFPVPVSVGDARQVITVNASGSYASVVAWELRGGVWRAVIQTRSARVGTHGVVPGSSRKQGTGTTPGGTFTMTEAFGIASRPATAMPYHQVTSDDWWVEDNNSAYYNQMRRASQGGFAVTTAGVNGSEHLVSVHDPVRVRRGDQLQPAAERRALPRGRDLPARQRPRLDGRLRLRARSRRWWRSSTGWTRRSTRASPSPDGAAACCQSRRDSVVSASYRRSAESWPSSPRGRGFAVWVPGTIRAAGPALPHADLPRRRIG